MAAVSAAFQYDGLDAVLEKDACGLPVARYLRGLAIDEPWQRSGLNITGEGGPTTGLAGWWKFNEGTGTLAVDSSGLGNNGTLINGATWATGVASNAVNLDGANDYVNVGDKATLEGNGTWTFAAWIDPDQFFSSRDTWLMYKQNVLQWGMLSGASRQMSVNIGGGGNNSLQGAVTNSVLLSSNAWTHVAVTYTNSTVKFYVNGVLTDTISKTYTMGSNNKAFSISTSAESFPGKLDDLRYYNRALSETEIQQVYGAQVTGHSVYLADALGSIVALTDTGKVIQTEYDYEPFGATTTTGVGNKNSYKFTAREDDGTGLYFYRARYYHPALGRFVSDDPLRELSGPNLYSYVRNNPLSFGDLMGLDAGLTGSRGFTEHRGVQVDVRDANGKIVGCLTADYFAQGFGQGEQQGSCGKCKTLLGKPGEIQLNFQPGKSCPKPVVNFKGSSKQDALLVEFILSTAGIPKTDLDAAIAKGKPWGGRFPGQLGYEKYRFPDNTCRDYASDALWHYQEFGK